METARVFYKNIEKLKSVHGLKRMSDFVEFINSNSGHGKVLSNSYVSKMKSGMDGGTPQNISANIIDGCASAFGVEAKHLIDPLGFNDNGKPRASTSHPDEAILEDAIRYAMIAGKKSGLEENIQFQARVAATAYKSHFKEDDEDLGFKILEILRLFAAT